MRPKSRFTTFILTALIALISIIVMAGSTGKLAGVVVDKATGAPIPGASVQIIGTSLGAITDAAGRFAIENVPPGTYSIRINSLWCQTIQMENIEIKADQDTKLTIELIKSEADLGKTIRVSVTKDRIDKYKVSSEVRPQAEAEAMAPVACMAMKSYPADRNNRASAEVGRIYHQRPASSQCGPSPAHGGTDIVNGEPYDATFYKDYGTNPFVDTEDDHLSTFAIDVDDASFIKARNYLEQGYFPPNEVIRVEEFINHFDYGYDPPVREPFAVHVEGAPSLFGENCQLLRIGIKGREISDYRRQSANLIFVVDVSGSMAREDRLGLVKQALHMLVDQLRRDDRVGIVVYGSEARVVLELTSDTYRIREAISSLMPTGATNAEAGLKLGYQMADRCFDRHRINRIILCSDGVANIGTTRAEDLLEWIRDYADRGITLSSIGFGMENYNDILLEKLGDKGNGNYAYVDDIEEAHRVFVENLTGMLQVIARDVKIQVDFNPEVVRSYRLIGYENRDVADNKFRDDKEDGGEIGAGHNVTALYEVKFHRNAPQGRVAEVYIRFKAPDETREADEVQFSITGQDFRRRFQTCTPEFKLAAAAAEFAEILGKSYWAKDSKLSDVYALVDDVYRQTRSGDIRELADLISLAERYQDQMAER
ncbi:MAG: von Willebrand factor type A domain-containing protein [candidate division Zixibacteria bacterium]|nr:von Willebrand factor type A domain-containing protein [candidate division Zixibacteria bacterium]